MAIANLADATVPSGPHPGPANQFSAKKLVLNVNIPQYLQDARGLATESTQWLLGLLALKV